MEQPRAAKQRRNKGFDETHQELIETAVRLISEAGVGALSIAALSRAMGINRTTVYYHFESREALIEAVTEWSSRQIALGMEQNTSKVERMGFIDHFVLENPELMKLWIDGFISGDDIRTSYPGWDRMIAGLNQHFAARYPGETIDTEAFCVIMLSSSIVGLRIFRNGVLPHADIETVIQRYMAEQRRQLARDGLAD
jgi:AcrR family transcriptional regulator